MAASLTDHDLSDDDIEQVKMILSKLQPGLLPLDIFIEFARLSVIPIIEIVPLRRNVEGKTEVLLLQREDSDPTWSGKLHTPGSVILATDQDPNNSDAAERILNGELDGVATTEPVFVCSILHRQKRGMEQSQIFFVEVVGSPSKGNFYNVTSLPADIVDTQLVFIRAAISKFELRSTT